jgi:sulfur transfer complex TusBCD TusB component (DsrH family)
LGDQYDRI